MFENKNKENARKWAAAFEILLKVDRRINPHLYIDNFYHLEIKQQKSLFEPSVAIVK